RGNGSCSGDQGEEAAEDREEGGAFDEGGRDDHVGADRAGGLGLTGDRLDGGGADLADAETAADDGEAGGETRTDALAPRGTGGGGFGHLVLSEGGGRGERDGGAGGDGELDEGGDLHGISNSGAFLAPSTASGAELGVRPAAHRRSVCNPLRPVGRLTLPAA